MLYKIAILIPCYNEEVTIESVVRDFRKELPDADIYVYDNNSVDNTCTLAKEAGATVKHEAEQGKGNVLRSMLRDIEADIYVLVDGDSTYPAQSVHDLISHIVQKKADLVVGDRLSNGTYSQENKRPLHDFGNNLVKNLINIMYKKDLKDIMSGYRAFTKEFAQFMPVVADGFEVETEMTIHALDKKFKIVEVPINYKDRPENSFSKLNTYLDGIKVIKTIFILFKDYKPLYFFTALSLLLALLSVATGIPVISEFIKTGYIHKVPSAILASSLMVLSIISFFSGLILDTNVRHHKEICEFMRKTQKK